MYKFGILKENELVEYKYPNAFAFEKTSGPDRLVISSEKDHSRLALDLAHNTSDQFGVLYILITSRLGNKLGRYQSFNPFKFSELDTFCSKYHSYFETDGRHHLWIISLGRKDLIVYDHHNVLYVYGNIDAKAELLKSRGYTEMLEIKYPSPHTHLYNKDNDRIEEEILSENQWRYFELMEGDSN